VGRFETRCTILHVWRSVCRGKAEHCDLDCEIVIYWITWWVLWEECSAAKRPERWTHAAWLCDSVWHVVTYPVVCVRSSIVYVTSGYFFTSRAHKLGWVNILGLNHFKCIGLYSGPKNTYRPTSCACGEISNSTSYFSAPISRLVLRSSRCGRRYSKLGRSSLARRSIEHRFPK